MSLVVLVAAVASHVSADVQTSTPCSLSFYRYLYNLPGEQIRPNVPEGTYVFGKRVGPPTQEQGQASNLQPAVLKPEPSYVAPEYLPPPSTTTTTTTTTLRPTTSAPTYIPPNPYYFEASNTIQSVLPPAKPTCDHPEHQTLRQYVDLLPPFHVTPTVPQYQPQPTFFVPKFVPLPQQPAASENEIVIAQPQKPRYPVPTPPPQFLRPYVQPSTFAPAPTPAHENCEKHNHPAPTTTTTTTTTTPPPPPPPTTPEPVYETRQNEIVIAPEAKPDCGHKQHNVVVESLGVPSTDYGVAAIVPQAPSAGYHYDKPAVPFGYPSSNVITGYNYPKPSPSFEFPGTGYAAQGTALFESESPKPSDDGDLVVLKV